MCCFLVTIKKSSKIWHFFTYFRLYFGHFKKFLNIGWKTAHGTLKFNFLEGFCFIWHPACPWERRAKVVEWRLKLLVKLYCLEWSWGPISPCTLCINDAKNSILNPPGPPIYTSTTLMSYAIDFLNSYKASWPIIFEYLPNRSTTAFCGKKKIEYYWLVKLAHFGITHYHYYFLSKINYKLETVSCKQSSQYMLIILSLGGREGLLTLNKNFILKQIIICMLETCINSLIFRWFPFQNVFAIHLTKALKVNEH